MAWYARPVIPLTRPDISEGAIERVAAVLRTGMLVQGAEVAAFEQAVAKRIGRKHAVAVANGTSALELSLTALGVGPGDGVLCPALTWPSPAHAVLTRGARLDLTFEASALIVRIVELAEGVGDLPARDIKLKAIDKPWVTVFPSRER